MTATELQLLSCFGVEPQLVDPNVPWVYNDAVYQVTVDGFSVSFAVQPSYRDVRLIVRQDGRRIYELNAVDIDDVHVTDEPGVDAVVVSLSDCSWLRLRLRPAFEITAGAGVDANGSMIAPRS